MTTETTEETEPLEEPEPTEEPAKPIEPTEPPKFEIKDLDDLKRILTIARGGDPDAIQAVTNFMDLKSPIERSYFPDKKTSICIGQLTGMGELYYPSDDWDPFNLIAKALAVAFMPYKGFKSNQFVDMTRTQPDLSGLQTTQDEMKRGFVDRILNRGTEK